MTQIFGDFRENIPEDHEFLILGFSPTSIPIQQRWRNNGLSADFVADYLIAFFPGSDDDLHTQTRQAEIKSAVNFIANELLENAMKFSNEQIHYPIKFGLHLLEETKVTVLLRTTNSLSTSQSQNFISFIDEFLHSDSQELYIQQLEKSAEDENSMTSGLGLLTMKNDYLAKLGWKFEKISQNDDSFAVTTMVQLIV